MTKNKKQRQQSHIYYESNCAICFNLFTHDRLSAVYCSKKCRNRARSFPQKMLDNLIRKAMLTLTSHKRVSEEQRIAITGAADTTTDIRQVARDIGLDPDTAKDLINGIEKIKAQRRLQAEAIRLNTSFTPTNEDDHTLIRDPEMKDFKLPNIGDIDQEVKDNLQFINKTDPANGGSDGFVIKDNDNKKIESMVQAEEPCPDCGSSHHRSCKKQTTGLRRLGGIK